MVQFPLRLFSVFTREHEAHEPSAFTNKNLRQKIFHIGKVKNCSVMAFSLVYHSACENIKADVTKWANKNVENQIRFELRTVTNK